MSDQPFSDTERNSLFDSEGEATHLRLDAAAGYLRREPGSGRRETLLLSLGQALRNAGDAEEAFLLAFRLFDRHLAVKRASLQFVEPTASGFRSLLSYGLSEEHWAPRPGRGLVSDVALTGKARFARRVDLEPEALDDLEHPSAWSGWSLACVPVVLHRRVVAVLSAYMRFEATADVGEIVDVLESALCLLAPLCSGLASNLAPIEGEGTVRAKADSASMEAQHFMLGNSACMRLVYEQIGRVAPTNATVLVRGETGAGKELVAHAIHAASARAGAELVRVNCAALPEALFESELFGHERGAFTGASQRRKGRFEQADGGTLFLDEIGELPLGSQAKLLRALQFREFERLGSPETIRVDIRLIAATNVDLERAVAAGTFREDLYHRINVFAVDLPPLRARTGDVALLAEHFTAQFSREHRKPPVALAPEVVDALSAYGFPGNVRELCNVLERAVVQCDGAEIQLRHLPEVLRGVRVGGRIGSLAEAVESVERRMLTEALERCNGVVARAATLLETTERVFRYKAQRYGIGYSRPLTEERK